MKKLTLSQMEYDQLVDEGGNLNFLQDCGLIFDAILFYLPQPHLSDKDREMLRQALEILASGGGN
jgi:hypothetical protein